MNANNLAIPVAFMILMAANLWIIIGMKGLWWVKSIFITATLALVLVVWGSIGTYAGWPSKGELPEEYQVIWVQVQEPTVDSEGQIFLWARHVESEMDLIPYDLFIYKPSIAEPRAYCLNYTRNLHEQSQKAIESLKKGKIVIGKKNHEGAHGSGDSADTNDEASGNQDSENAAGQTMGGDPYFFELPPAKFIEKN